MTTCPLLGWRAKFVTRKILARGSNLRFRYPQTPRYRFVIQLLSDVSCLDVLLSLLSSTMKLLRFTFAACSAIVLLTSIAGAAASLGLPEKSPAELGFDAKRLEHVPAMLRRETEAQRYAGAVWLIARNGAIASHGAVGFSDVATKKPLTEDTVFRIFSMSKIVTSVTALSLLEEGRIGLDDPVERYLPELGKLQVFTGGTLEAPQLVPAKGAITVRHLLAHTAKQSVRWRRCHWHTNRERNARTA